MLTFSCYKRVKKVNSPFLAALSPLFANYTLQFVLPNGISQDDEETDKRYHERQGDMGGIGYHSHQQEAASAYRSHHQEGGCRLRKIAQSRKSETEDGWEHDGLKKIVGYQGYQR